MVPPDEVFRAHAHCRPWSLTLKKIQLDQSLWWLWNIYCTCFRVTQVTLLVSFLNRSWNIQSLKYQLWWSSEYCSYICNSLHDFHLGFARLSIPKYSSNIYLGFGASCWEEQQSGIKQGSCFVGDKVWRLWDPHMMSDSLIYVSVQRLAANFLLGIKFREPVEEG